MADVREKVLAEMELFKKALPDLLAEYEGKWVVFQDGRVVEAFDDEDEAYVAAVERFGVGSGFLLKQVVEDTGPVPISGGVGFHLFSFSS